MSQVQKEGSPFAAIAFGEAWKHFSDTSEVEAFMIGNSSELIPPQ